METVFVAVIIYCVKMGQTGTNCVSTLGRSTPFKTQVECETEMSKQFHTKTECLPTQVETPLESKTNLQVSI